MHLRSLTRPLLGLGVLLAACDPGSLQHNGPTIGSLSGLVLFSDAGRSNEDACSLNASWPLPSWPTTSSSDTATVQLTRQVVLPPAAAIARDTIISGVSIRLDRQDSTHILLRLGAPFTDTLTGQLDQASGRVLTGTWKCGSNLPLGQDSTLLAHGYLTDSVATVAGTLTVTRYTPID